MLCQKCFPLVAHETVTFSSSYLNFDRDGPMGTEYSPLKIHHNWNEKLYVFATETKTKQVFFGEDKSKKKCTLFVVQ